MSKTILRLFLVLIFVIAIQACVPPGVATPNLEFISTSIAQTFAAFTPSPSPGIPVTGDESPTPTLTMTTAATVTAFPTETAMPTATQVVASPTAFVIITPAFTPGMTQVSVSVPTNCRVGPGVAYERVGGLQVGEVADVVGRDAAGTYWIIRNPARPSQTCWLWGQYATVSGNTDGLPIFTPPPLPTPVPGFDVAFDGLESCTGTGWWVDLDLENTGDLAFRSITLTVRDLDTDVSLIQYANGFTNKNGCDESQTRDALAPDASRIVSSPAFDYDPSGHRLRAIITLCSNTGQSGTCVTQTVNFRP